MKKYLYTMLISIIFYGCWDIPDNITSPTWDTDFNLPLTKKHYLLKELIKTDKYISIDENFIYTASHQDLSVPHQIASYLTGKIDQSVADKEIQVVNGTGKTGIAFKDGIEIDSAILESGNLNLSVKNNTNGNATITLTIPGFISPNGNPLIIQEQVSKGQTYNVAIDLTNYRFYAYLQSLSNDSLELQGSLSGETTEGTLVIGYSLINSNFRYFAGKIPPTKIETIQSSINLPITDDVTELRDKIKFHSAEFTLIGYYLDKLPLNDPNKPFPFRIDKLEIIGVRNGNETINLKLNESEDNNLGPINIENGSFTKTFTIENTNLSTFLAFIPDSIYFIVESTANPNFVKGAATNKDSIQVGYELLIKSVVSVDELTYSDTTDFEIDSDIRDNIKDFKAATIFTKIDNKVGFSGNIVMTFLDKTEQPLFSLDTLSYAPADVSLDGNTTVKHSELTIELDSSQIQKLANSYKIILDIIINTSKSKENQKVIFKSEDWLDIISFCTVKYNVNFE